MKKVARIFAREVCRRAPNRGAIILALEGGLGSGKTTFAQGFSGALGVREAVKSPTFLIIKVYALSRPRTARFRDFVHIDCYRIGSPRELVSLGFEKLIKDRRAIILIEWAGRIRKLLARRAVIWINFAHGRKHNERIIGFEKFK